MARKTQRNARPTREPSADTLRMTEKIVRRLIDREAEAATPDILVVALADLSLQYAASVMSRVEAGGRISLGREVFDESRGPDAEQSLAAIVRLNEALTHAANAKAAASKTKDWFSLVAESRPARLGSFDGYSWATALSYASEVHRQFVASLLGDEVAMKTERWIGPRNRAGRSSVFMDSEPLVVSKIEIDDMLASLRASPIVRLREPAIVTVSASEHRDLRRELGALEARLMRVAPPARVASQKETSDLARDVVRRVFSTPKPEDSPQSDAADTRDWTLTQMASAAGVNMKTLQRGRKAANLIGVAHRRYAVADYRKIIDAIRRGTGTKRTGPTYRGSMDADKIAAVLNSAP